MSKYQILNVISSVMFLLPPSLSVHTFFQVSGQVTDIPVELLWGKIQVSYKEGKAQLKTNFDVHVHWNSIVVTHDS